MARNQGTILSLPCLAGERSGRAAVLPTTSRAFERGIRPGTSSRRPPTIAQTKRYADQSLISLTPLARAIAERIGISTDFLGVREIGFDLARVIPFAKPMLARKFARTCLAAR